MSEIRLTRGSALSAEEMDWLRLAAADQVPLAWIAETVGRHYTTVQKIVKELRIPLDPDWTSIQLQCRHSKVLGPLHEEFMPLN